MFSKYFFSNFKSLQNFYYMKNFKIPSNTFPSWFPKAKFLVTVKGYDGADKKPRLFLHVLLYGEIKKKE